MAMRRVPPPQPERPELTTQQKINGVYKLKKRIEELQAFDPQTVTERHSDPRVLVLETAIDEALSDLFGHGTTEYYRYSIARHLDNGPISMSSDWSRDQHHDANEAQRYLTEGKVRAVALLEQAIRRLEEEIADQQSEETAGTTLGVAQNRPVGRNVFIVHGHDEAMKEAVARFLTQIGFVPIILHEQANIGRTVIEKVEDYAGAVGFAVVLLSPDDEGCAVGETLQPRARQNVLLELGYFIGLLGRERVCALKRGNIELPSDFGGVVFEKYDSGWKEKLGRELEAVGYEIDWNKVMRP
jgi:predicted nucleotide-binding protein